MPRSRDRDFRLSFAEGSYLRLTLSVGRVPLGLDESVQRKNVTSEDERVDTAKDRIEASRRRAAFHQDPQANLRVNKVQVSAAKAIDSPRSPTCHEQNGPQFQHMNMLRPMVLGGEHIVPAPAAWVQALAGPYVWSAKVPTVHTQISTTVVS